MSHSTLLETTAPPAEFASPGPLRDHLVQLVLDGVKCTTSTLFVEFELAGDALPKVGERRFLLDSQRCPVAVIETVDVRVSRLVDVDLAHVLDEGAGYLTVAQWRDAHERFWRTPEVVQALGEVVIDDDTQVVLERFRVVED